MAFYRSVYELIDVIIKNMYIKIAFMNFYNRINITIMNWDIQSFLFLYRKVELLPIKLIFNPEIFKSSYTVEYSTLLLLKFL